MTPTVSPDRLQGFYDEQAETMSRDAIRAMHEGILGTLTQFCFDNSSTYREKFERAGIGPEDIASLDDLTRIPVTRKDETQGLRFEGVMTVPYNHARRIFVSPGPQFYAYGPIPHKANPLLKVYHAIGMRPGDIVLNTLTYHLTPAGINFDESLGEFGCAVIPAGPGNTDLQVQILQQLDVTGYVGTPSFLRILADKAADMGVTPREDFSMECALTTAETLREELRAEMEDAYGCIVRQLYGSADGLMPCFECWAADGMHVPEIMILEITDPETGDPLPPGEAGAVTASVMNPYRPLLRFCNGDRGMLVDEPCRCGRTSIRFRFLGRIDESTKVRGMFVYPEQIAEAMAPFERPWHAVVEADERGLDRFVVEIEGSADDSLKDRVAEAIRGIVRLRADVTPVEKLSGDAGHLTDRRSA
ncbi:MAG: phenylacetate--CoA ligase family protein [Actinomycetota bacterium]